jgi:hypothetical protein
MFNKKYKEQINLLTQELDSTNQRIKELKKIIFDNIGRFVDYFYVAQEPEIHFQTVYIPDSEGNDFTNNLQKEIYEEIKKVEESFSDKLMQIIREKKLNEVEVYKKADLDRRHFSKIRSNPDYRTTKETVILLCLSMELNYEETTDLLNRAGYSLSKSSKQDLIAQYFIQRNIYDILLYKEILFEYGLLK